MWQRNLVYEYFPTLTKTGKEIRKKRLVSNPSDVECWFSSAHNRDIDILSHMLSKNFNINSLNLNEEHIGLIACQNKCYPILEFFIQHQGDLNYKTPLSQESLYDIVCYSNQSIKMFKLIWDTKALPCYIQEDWISLLNQLVKTPLFHQDKNLPKIKYLFNKMNKQFILTNKRILLQFLINIHHKIPQIVYFLQDKNTLLKKLKKSLNTKPYIVRNKI